MPEDLKVWAEGEAVADPKAKGNLSEMIRHMLIERRRQRRAELLEGIKTHEF